MEILFCECKVVMLLCSCFQNWTWSTQAILAKLIREHGHYSRLSLLPNKFKVPIIWPQTPISWQKAYFLVLLCVGSNDWSQWLAPHLHSPFFSLHCFLWLLFIKDHLAWSILMKGDNQDAHGPTTVASLKRINSSIIMRIQLSGKNQFWQNKINCPIWRCSTSVQLFNCRWNELSNMAYIIQRKLNCYEHIHINGGAMFQLKHKVQVVFVIGQSLGKKSIGKPSSNNHHCPQNNSFSFRRL
jgi:hypothetical protein